MTNEKCKMTNGKSLLLASRHQSPPLRALSFAVALRFRYTSALPIAPGSHLSLMAPSGARLAAFFEGGVYVRP